VTEKELFLLGDGEPITIETITVVYGAKVVRWCFTCRKSTEHSTITTVPMGEDSMSSLAEVHCLSCGGKDTDLFPGKEREDDQPE
jgi:hypothetical protein